MFNYKTNSLKRHRGGQRDWSHPVPNYLIQWFSTGSQKGGQFPPKFSSHSLNRNSHEVLFSQEHSEYFKIKLAKLLILFLVDCKMSFCYYASYYTIYTYYAATTRKRIQEITKIIVSYSRRLNCQDKKCRKV